MKTSSCKAKGRRLSQKIRELILKKFINFKDQDIVVTPSGVNGPDVWLSSEVFNKFPFVIEAKNQEKLNIWDALKQAEGHQKALGGHPLLFFSRNNSKIYVALEAEVFLKFLP